MLDRFLYASFNQQGENHNHVSASMRLCVYASMREGLIFRNREPAGDIQCADTHVWVYTSGSANGLLYRRIRVGIPRAFHKRPDYYSRVGTGRVLLR